MKSAVFIKCSEVSDESHRKKFVDFYGISRAVCHILPSKIVAVFANLISHLTQHASRSKNIVTVS